MKNTRPLSLLSLSLVTTAHSQSSAPSVQLSAAQLRTTHCHAHQGHPTRHAQPHLRFALLFALLHPSPLTPLSLIHSTPLRRLCLAHSAPLHSAPHHSARSTPLRASPLHSTPTAMLNLNAPPNAPHKAPPNAPPKTPPKSPPNALPKEPHNAPRRALRNAQLSACSSQPSAATRAARRIIKKYQHRPKITQVGGRRIKRVDIVSKVVCVFIRGWISFAMVNLMIFLKIRMTTPSPWSKPNEMRARRLN
jgi:hypothetical protein